MGGVDWVEVVADDSAAVTEADVEAGEGFFDFWTILKPFFVLLRKVVMAFLNNMSGWSESGYSNSPQCGQLLSSSSRSAVRTPVKAFEPI